MYGFMKLSIDELGLSEILYDKPRVPLPPDRIRALVEGKLTP